MSFKIVSEVENNLLKRKEIKLSLDHTGKSTPSRKELISELAKLLHKTEDVIVLLKIESVNGTSHSLLTVFVYNKKEEIPKHITELMEQRISGKKAAAAPPAK